MLYSKEYPDFLTATCLEWKPLLHTDGNKDFIIDSLSYLTQNNRAVVYGFVIMINHLHLIWQLLGSNKRDSVQRDFLKYTGQHILLNIKNSEPARHKELYVGAKDRKFQVWERNSLSIRKHPVKYRY
ncbi:hypothetical protein BH09BAC3_BH09BAC3_37950 [soil metagenome]